MKGDTVVESRRRLVLIAMTGSLSMIMLDQTVVTGHLTDRPGDLLLNWLVPGALILLSVRYTRRIAGAAHTTAASAR